MNKEIKLYFRTQKSSTDVTLLITQDSSMAQLLKEEHRKIFNMPETNICTEHQMLFMEEKVGLNSEGVILLEITCM